MLYYTFSSVQVAYNKIDYTSNHKTNFRFKLIEISQNVFLDYNQIKLEINNNKSRLQKTL